MCVVGIVYPKRNVVFPFRRKIFILNSYLSIQLNRARESWFVNGCMLRMTVCEVLQKFILLKTVLFCLKKLNFVCPFFSLNA